VPGSLVGVLGRPGGGPSWPAIDRGTIGVMTTVSLRPATAADSEFCYRVHRRAMRAVVDEVWGWIEQDQKAFHVRGYDPAQTQIVVVDGVPAGVLIVHDRPSSLYLGRIELDPAVQGRGIGTTLIAGLQERATALGRPLVLEVLLANQRAYALYRRLGFREVRRSGPKREMHWLP
jgi:ribosomal protein S18 acetylase RimI-like enzyme